MKGLYQLWGTRLPRSTIMKKLMNVRTNTHIRTPARTPIIMPAIAPPLRLLAAAEAAAA